MKRLIAIALVLLLLAGCAGSPGAAPSAAPGSAPGAAAGEADEVIKINFGTNVGSTHTVAPYYQGLVDDLNQYGEGRIEAKIFFSEQLGNERECMDLVSNDINDILYAPALAEVARRYDPCLVFDAPYMFRDEEHMLRFANGESAKPMWEELAEDYNIRMLGVFYFGTRNVTSNFPAMNPDDLKGFKMRVMDSPISIATGKALGASPTPMQIGEVYMAMQQGVIDGQENPTTVILSNKFNEVQDYVIMTRHSVTAVGFCMSEKKWQSLPDDIKEIIQTAVDRAVDEGSRGVAAQEIENLKELEELGMTVVEPDFEAFRENAKSVLDEFSGQWGEWYDIVQSIEG